MKNGINNMVNDTLKCVTLSFSSAETSTILNRLPDTNAHNMIIAESQ
jgi:hypothetical protein